MIIWTVKLDDTPVLAFTDKQVADDVAALLGKGALHGFDGEVTVKDARAPKREAPQPEVTMTKGVGKKDKHADTEIGDEP